MTNLNKNQQAKMPVAHFIKKSALWLYTNAERVEYHLSTILDGIALLVGLGLCFGLLLIGGAL